MGMTDTPKRIVEAFGGSVPFMEATRLPYSKLRSALAAGHFNRKDEPTIAQAAIDKGIYLTVLDFAPHLAFLDEYWRDHKQED